ncbi:MAG: ATP-binding protein [Victivallaceae bacterium]|nr:ATP-binding protein [Victivallaceae bacterium]
MVNRVLEMISVETDFDKSVNVLLSMTGRELHSDRCYVCMFHDNCSYSVNTHEWVSRPELAEIQNLQHVPMPDDNWMRLLARREPVVIVDTSIPPDNFHKTIAILAPQNIKSIFVVGLWAGGKLSGILGVDYVDHSQAFSENILQTLTNAARLYDIVCERYRNHQEIERKNTELRNREALFDLIINALSANIFVKDADDHFRYVMANRKFADFVGKSANEVVGKTDRDLFASQDDCEWFESRDAEIMKSGQSRNFPETVYGADQKKYQFQTIKTPCVGPTGEKLLLGISVDTTPNVDLSKSREIIRQCLETLVLNPNLEDGVSRSIEQVREYVKADRIYIFQFDFAQNTGSIYKEFCNQGRPRLLSGLQWVPLSSAFDWKNTFRENCFMNVPDAQEETSLKRFGSYYGKIVLELDCRSLYCHRLLIDGKLWGYLGIVYENSPRILNSNELDFVQSAARFVEIMIRHEHMQSELLQALKEAKSAEKAKSYFLATMSHEIRTPLNAVIGFSEILKDGTLPPETQKSYLNDISVAGNALLALINDVLDLSKLEAGQMVFSPGETDFPALVSEVLTVFQQWLRDKKLKTEIHIDPMPTLLLDKGRMRQILFNLMGNAVKFTDRGHIDFTCSFTPSGDSSGTLRFSLADTGCGISEEDQKRLFQPFVQSNAVRGTQAERNGTGLGLAIIRRMLERINGEITLESKLGQGSVFTVEMRKVEYVVKRHVNVSGEAAPLETPHHISGKVLVVDDVVMNLKVTQAMLKKIGVESEIANGAEAALACLEKTDIKLVLCDLWMPVMNGDELARKIRKLYSDRKIKIAALTADTETGSAFDMSEFDAVLHKPVNMGRLRELLANLG